MKLLKLCMIHFENDDYKEIFPYIVTSLHLTQL